MLRLDRAAVSRARLSLFFYLLNRDVLQRYRGTWFGLFWVLVAPFLLISVYGFFFQSFFPAKWPSTSILGISSSDSLVNFYLSDSLLFVINLFIGLVVLSAFSDVVGRSTRIVIDQPQFVKRVVFPLSILPIVLVFSALFQAICQLMIVWLITLVSVVYFSLFSPYCAAESAGTSLVVSVIFSSFTQAFLSLLILCCFIPSLLAFSFWFAAIGTYFRDLSQVSPVLITASMFFAPIFYPRGALPTPYRDWIGFNPLTVVIEQMRLVLVGGGHIDWLLLCKFIVVWTLIAGLGYSLFERVKSGFSDVL